MPGALQMTGTFKKVPSQAVNIISAPTVSEGLEPSSVHSIACRKTHTSPCVRVSIHQRQLGWFSAEGYCKDKREHL